MNTSKITISRTNQFVNNMRNVHLYIDDKKIDSIANNETKTLEIPEGEHRFHAKIDWCKTRPITFNVQAGEEKKFELGSPRTQIYSAFKISLLFFVGVFLGIYLESDLIFWLAIASAILWIAGELFFSKEKPLAYYLTIGRNEFIYLKEI